MFLLRGVQSHLVAGVLKEASDEQIIIFGSHINDDYPNAIDFANRQDFTVIIKPDTKFVKLVWYFPESLEALTKKRVILNPTEIKKEIGQTIIQLESERIPMLPHHVCHLLNNNKSQKENGRINLEL